MAAHIDSLRRRGVPRSSAIAVVSALAWRGRRQGVPSPCESLARILFGDAAQDLKPA